jgi:hypothetical protein
MKKKWTLHILSHKGSVSSIPSTYTVALSQGTGPGGGMPTVHHPSWHHLSVALRAIGVDESKIAELKAEIDSKHSVNIQEVSLDETDVRQLGFTEQQVPTAMFV